METIVIIAVITGAYLLGSIPNAIWIGKLFYGIDVRQHGSMNAGATNTFRVLGTKAGVPVLALDILKGWLAVKLAYLTFLNPEIVWFSNLQVLLGILAVVGHIFPVFAGFKGGKGVAAFLGIFIAILPFSALLSVGVFVVTLLLTRYVSLSSILAGISFPIFVIMIFRSDVPSFIVVSIVVSAIILITHHKNIRRLINREENKANLFKKKSGNSNASN